MLNNFSGNEFSLDSGLGLGLGLGLGISKQYFIDIQSFKPKHEWCTDNEQNYLIMVLTVASKFNTVSGARNRLICI